MITEKINRLKELLGVNDYMIEDAGISENLLQMVDNYKQKRMYGYNENMQNILKILEVKKCGKKICQQLAEKIHCGIKEISTVHGAIDPGIFDWGGKHEFTKILTEQKKKGEYNKFFNALAKSHGINPDDMDNIPSAKKKKFFAELDSKWNAKNENEQIEYTDSDYDQFGNLTAAARKKKKRKYSNAEDDIQNVISPASNEEEIPDGEDVNRERIRTKEDIHNKKAMDAMLNKLGGMLRNAKGEDQRNKLKEKMFKILDDHWRADHETKADDLA